jgi:glycosyltransferase involved in cell wall biosynthesis
MPARCDCWPICVSAVWMRVCCCSARIRPIGMPIWPELEALADQLGLRDCWLALPQTADVARIYACSDLILQLSSRPESFGRTVAEALQLGRPVLGWALGGVGEQLRACFPAGMVTHGDAAALADRAIELLRQPLAHQIDRSTIATVADMQRQTLAVYAELLDKAAD